MGRKVRRADHQPALHPAVSHQLRLHHLTAYRMVSLRRLRVLFGKGYSGDEGTRRRIWLILGVRLLGAGQLRVLSFGFFAIFLDATEESCAICWRYSEVCKWSSSS